MTGHGSPVLKLITLILISINFFSCNSEGESGEFSQLKINKSLTTTYNYTGVLDAVTDLTVEYDCPSGSYVFSWTAPLSGEEIAPPSNYCISITNVSSGLLVLSETCELLNTTYSAAFVYNPCLEYSATVFAMNPAGKGRPAVIAFPRTVWKTIRLLFVI